MDVGIKDKKIGIIVNEIVFLFILYFWFKNYFKFYKINCKIIF